MSRIVSTVVSPDAGEESTMPAMETRSKILWSISSRFLLFEVVKLSEGFCAQLLRVVIAPCAPVAGALAGYAFGSGADPVWNEREWLRKNLVRVSYCKKNADAGSSIMPAGR